MTYAPDEIRALLDGATPGPWMAAAKPSSVVGWPIVSNTGNSIASAAAYHPSDPEDYKASRHANADLIAAAPALAAQCLDQQAQLKQAMLDYGEKAGMVSQHRRALEEQTKEIVRLRTALTQINALDPEWQGIESISDAGVRGLVMGMGQIARQALQEQPRD